MCAPVQKLKTSIFLHVEKYLESNPPTSRISFCDIAYFVDDDICIYGTDI